MHMATMQGCVTLNKRESTCSPLRTLLAEDNQIHCKVGTAIMKLLLLVMLLHPSHVPKHHRSKFNCEHSCTGSITDFELGGG